MGVGVVQFSVSVMGKWLSQQTACPASIMTEVWSLEPQVFILKLDMGTVTSTWDLSAGEMEGSLGLAASQPIFIW